MGLQPTAQNLMEQWHYSNHNIVKYHVIKYITKVLIKGFFDKEGLQSHTDPQPKSFIRK